MKSIVKKSGILILLVISASLAIAQVNVVKISGPEVLAGKKGIVYNLPRTMVHVSLSITKTEYVPGPLAAYATDYLGVNNIPDKGNVEYEIVSATINTFTEPDPEQYYLIQKEEKSSGEIWISFGEQAPVNIMEKFPEEVSPGSFNDWNGLMFFESDAARLFRKYTESPSREIVDTIIRKVSIDTVIVEDVVFRHSMVEFSDKEKAREAVDRIRQIENDQYNLLIGYPETAYSKEALEFMLNRLESQRQEYVRLFTGVTLTQNLNFEYKLLPDPENEDGNYVLAGFSNHSGIIEANGQNAIKVIISEAQDNTSIGLTGGQEALSSGLAYRIPSFASVAVTFQDRQIASERMMILQFSPVLTLPPDIKRVDFDPVSGTLRSVIME